MAMYRIARVGTLLLLGLACTAAMPASPRLSMIAKTEERMNGHFVHDHGTMVFSAAPHNLTIETIMADGSIVQVLHASKHCVVPHEDGVSCKDGGRYTVVAMAPSSSGPSSLSTSAAVDTVPQNNKLLEVDGKFFRLSEDLNTKDERAISAFFHENKALLDASHAASVPESAYDEASGDFMESHGHHMSPLPALYAAMYAEHEIVGRFFPSAIPLYVLAMNVDEALKTPSGERDADVATITEVNHDGSHSDKGSEDGRRRTQWNGGSYFMSSSDIDACSNAGYTRDDPYCTPVFGCWDWSASSCGHRCKNGGTVAGSCGSSSPDCSDSCTGMCGPSCTTCWPGVCGDCCLWEGCYIHDNDCRVGAIIVQLGYGCVGGALNRATITSYQGQQGKVNWCTAPTEDDGSSGGSNSCRYAGDGECDVPAFCTAGTDGSDCCGTSGGDTCRYAHDGECDVPAYCTKGTDNSDCCGGGGH